MPQLTLDSTHKFKLRLGPAGYSKGNLIEMNGKRLDACTAFSLSTTVEGLTQVTLTLVNVEIEAEVEADQGQTKTRQSKKKGSCGKKLH